MEWCALALPLVVAACGSESGIVVDVRTDETVVEPIDKLVFVEGHALGDDPFAFQQDDLDGVVEADVSGRNLAVDGYRLMYKDADGSGKPFMVAVVGKAGGQIVAFGAMAAPVAFKDGQVLEVDVTLGAGFNGEMLDTGCLRYWIGEQMVILTPDDDADCDGSRACDVPGGLACDCDDGNAAINPSATEDCTTTEIDENCNGDPMENVDNDMDGVTTCDGDCDDGNQDVNPNRQEECDGIDNDCDGKCDDGFDFDGDTYTTCHTQVIDVATCIPVSVGDCDDTNPAAHEGSAEICDGMDNDCNEVCDDAEGANGGEALDPDDDGFTFCGTIPGRCLDPNPTLVDCEPTVGEVHPFAAEACDGFDTNCDGAPMAVTPCFGTFDGECTVGTATCDDTLGDLHDCAAGPIDAAGPVPASLCASYDECVLAGSTTPFECASDSADPVVTVTCSLHHTPFGVLCPERFAPVSGDPSAMSCTWWILGGRFQSHYEVGLSSESTPTPSDAMNQCLGAFGVLVKRDVVPQPDRVILGYTDDLLIAGAFPTELVEVNIVPVEVSTCDAATPGLECTIAIP